jgi:hypothetical protein
VPIQGDNLHRIFEHLRRGEGEVLDEMTGSYHSMFRSVCSVPVFRWFHVDMFLVPVCWFIFIGSFVHRIVGLFYSRFFRFSSEYRGKQNLS